MAPYGKLVNRRRGIRVHQHSIWDGLGETARRQRIDNDNVSGCGRGTPCTVKGLATMNTVLDTVLATEPLIIFRAE